MSQPIESNDAALAAPYLQGQRQRQLRYQRCTACHTAQTLARYACAQCGSEQLAWQAAAGTAQLYAVTVVSRAPSDAFRALAPYTLVIAELDEGPRLMAHAVAGVEIGDRVVAEYFEHDGCTLVRFAPTAS